MLLLCFWFRQNAKRDTICCFGSCYGGKPLIEVSYNRIKQVAAVGLKVAVKEQKKSCCHVEKISELLLSFLCCPIMLRGRVVAEPPPMVAYIKVLQGTKGWG